VLRPTRQLERAVFHEWQRRGRRPGTSRRVQLVGSYARSPSDHAHHHPNNIYNYAPRPALQSVGDYYPMAMVRYPGVQPATTPIRVCGRVTAYFLLSHGIRRSAKEEILEGGSRPCVHRPNHGANCFARGGVDRESDPVPLKDESSFLICDVCLNAPGFAAYRSRRTRRG
jgi:hypothetical protein